MTDENDPETAIETIRETAHAIGRKYDVRYREIAQILDSVEIVEGEIDRGLIDESRSADGGDARVVAQATDDGDTALESWANDETARLENCEDVTILQNGKPQIVYTCEKYDEPLKRAFPWFMPVLRHIVTFAEEDSPISSTRLSRDLADGDSGTTTATLTPLTRAGFVERNKNSSGVYQYWPTPKARQYCELYDDYLKRGKYTEPVDEDDENGET